MDDTIKLNRAKNVFLVVKLRYLMKLLKVQVQDDICSMKI